MDHTWREIVLNAIHYRWCSDCNEFGRWSYLTNDWEIMPVDFDETNYVIGKILGLNIPYIRPTIYTSPFKMTTPIRLVNKFDELRKLIKGGVDEVKPLSKFDSLRNLIKSGNREE